MEATFEYKKVDNLLVSPYITVSLSLVGVSLGYTDYHQGRGQQ